MIQDTRETEVLSRIRWEDEGEVTGNRIPREIYTDEDLYGLELEKVFKGPTWHLVAHEAEIPDPGDYKTTRIAETPIIVSRSNDGEISVLVNACAHRGARVVMERYGNAARSGFRCIYHQWGYSLDGRCTAVAMPEGFPEDFRKEDYGLPKVRTEILAGAIFATFSDETPPLREYLGDEKFIEQISRSLWDGNLKLLGEQKIVFDTNWKLYMENMYDGYHALSLHKGVRLLAGKNAKRPHGETNSPNYLKYGHGWQSYLNVGSDEDQFNDMSIVAVKSKPANEEGYKPNDILFSFPANIVSDQADTLTIRYVKPKGVDKTEVHFTIFGQADEDEEMLQHRVRQGSNLFGPVGLITLEDGAALARIQMSASARGDSVVLKGSPKRFPPYRLNDEGAIRHFYGAYRRVMGF